jgi:hypothetical protein
VDAHAALKAWRIGERVGVADRRARLDAPRRSGERRGDLILRLVEKKRVGSAQPQPF